MKFATIAPKGLRFTINNKALFILKLGIASLLLFVLIHNIKIENIQFALKQANFVFICLAGLLLIPNLFIQCVKWHYLLKLCKPNAKYLEAVKSLLSGFTLGFITPGRIGELGRAIFVKDCNRIQVLSLTMVDKLFSMAMVFLMGTIALFLLLGVKLGSELINLWLAIALAAFFVVGSLTLFPEKLRNSLYRIKSRLHFKEKSELLLSGIDNFNRHQACILFGLNLLFYMIFVTQFYLLLSAFQSIQLIDGYLVVASTIVVKSLLPISFGDLGIRETAAIYFVSKIAAQPSTAFNASIFVFLINIVLPSLIGFGLLMTEKINNRRMLTDGRTKVSDSLKNEMIDGENEQ